MNEGLIPRRYAKALYKVALEKGQTAEMYGLMSCLVASFRGNPDLNEVVNNPFQSTSDKIGLLTTAAGADSSRKLYADFLKLLVENRRLGMAESIARAYIGIYREENNIKVVRLTVAAPIPASEEERLKTLIERHIGGATMEFSQNVDPSLIGGFRVTVDNERLDATISNELKQLRLNLLSKQAI